MSQQDEIPTKDALEKQKLAVEVIKIEKDTKYEFYRLILTGCQTVAVVVGVYLAVSEFVIKDLAQEKKQQSITLSLIERGDSSKVRIAREALMDLSGESTRISFQPTTEKFDREIAEAIIKSFDSKTRDLTSYYRTLNRGIKAGYLDADLVVNLLSSDIRFIGETLDELVFRLGAPGTTKRNSIDIIPFCDYYDLREILEPSKPWKNDWGYDPCD